MSSESKPYGKLQLAFAYFKYRRKAVSRHGVHPPRMYEFADQVLRKMGKAGHRDIEAERKRFTKSIQEIAFIDYGKNGTSFQKKVSDIARRSLKSKKYARLLGRICQHYKVEQVLELGTSLGISTAYMARHASHVTTMEGSQEVLNLAKMTWGHLGLANISSIAGNFDQTLDSLNQQKFDVIFIDGNHHYLPTLRYFEQLLKNAHEDTLFIFDDINWSPDMQKAWNEVKMHERTTTTVDIFYMGFAWISPSLSRQDFILKY